MKKNRKDQSWGNGIIVSANGIVTNDNPGPPLATFAIGIPVLSINIKSDLLTSFFLYVKFTSNLCELYIITHYQRDINPKTENTTNPAKMLVAQLTMGTNIESLKFKF